MATTTPSGPMEVAPLITPTVQVVNTVSTGQTAAISPPERDGTPEAHSKSDLIIQETESEEERENQKRDRTLDIFKYEDLC